MLMLKAAVDRAGNIHNVDLNFFEGVRFLKNERSDYDRILIWDDAQYAVSEEAYGQLVGIGAKVVCAYEDGKRCFPYVIEKSALEAILSAMPEDGSVTIEEAITKCEIPICDVPVLTVRPTVELALTLNANFLDAKTVALLESIDATGSKQAACAEVGVSYSKGSKMIKGAELELGYPLLKRWSGGLDGGGSELTEECRTLILNYKKMLAEVQIAAQKAYAKYMQ